MLNQPQIRKMIGKIERLENTLYERIFTPVDTVDFAFLQTADWLTTAPNDGYRAIARGEKWGGEGMYGWFRTTYRVTDALQGKRLFLMPHIGCYEGMLFVNGEPFGTFANKHQVQYTEHGNHYCDRFAESAAAGEEIELTLELYCGHFDPGNHPFSKPGKTDFTYTYGGADICVKNEAYQEFYFDLRTVRQLAQVLPEDDFRRGQAVAALYQIHNRIMYDAENAEGDAFFDALRECQPLLKQFLSSACSDSAPFAGLTGHSHMDTAWLWHVGETVKKCARTYSNALNLMDQYPEYRFLQSSSCHSHFMQKYYPGLFERIRQKVKEGRYEPNGGVWVECDCNITSGESMIRQFLWGQRFTQKYFDYTSDVFWLPDTFGYSASIPQIMRGCGCSYFMTTKIGWNDTNRFPYDSFIWEGIDGSRVFTHFNTTHQFPDVQDMYERFGEIAQPEVTNMKYMAYGFGDGGGGPTYELLESARRCGDLEGLGKSRHMSASAFMRQLESTVKNPNVYRGELYLELHRGTLTNQHTIKRNNRKSEIAIHNLEFLTVSNALRAGQPARHEAIDPLVETLLLNQFHDILPGTCIHRAHEESRAATTKLLSDANRLIAEASAGKGEGITLINTLSFDRSDPVFLPYRQGWHIQGGYRQQVYTNLDGETMLILCGVTVPAFSSVTLQWKKGEVVSTPFAVRSGSTLTTPFARVTMDESGAFSSFVDIIADRELRGEGYALNTFLMAEDVPCSWDNWDIDADIEGKLKPQAVLLSSEVVSSGACAYILRNAYRLSEKSTLTQDIIFFADSPEVRFDTKMDWQEEHRLLKACFDTTIREDFARQEIQFGYVKRPTTRNTSLEQAKFEVLNHKYTDLSESRFGVAILNDCKYGMLLNGSRMALSLHKGGVRPDHLGDKGVHRCVYSFLPHSGGFSAKAVIQPAYSLNTPLLISEGRYEVQPPIVCEADNILVETIKPCEDAENAFIARLYEAEGTYTHTACTLSPLVKEGIVTDMLEQPQSDGMEEIDRLTFRPFEIKTIKIRY